MSNGEGDRGSSCQGKGNSFLKEKGSGHNRGKGIEQKGAVQSVGEENQQDAKQKIANQNEIGHQAPLPPAERREDSQDGIDSEYTHQDYIELNVRHYSQIAPQWNLGEHHRQGKGQEAVDS